MLDNSWAVGKIIKIHITVIAAPSLIFVSRITLQFFTAFDIQRFLSCEKVPAGCFVPGFDKMYNLH
jgi:hypothetical protein